MDERVVSDDDLCFPLRCNIMKMAGTPRIGDFSFAQNHIERVVGDGDTLRHPRIARDPVIQRRERLLMYDDKCGAVLPECGLQAASAEARLDDIEGMCHRNTVLINGIALAAYDLTRDSTHSVICFVRRKARIRKHVIRQARQICIAAICASECLPGPKGIAHVEPSAGQQWGGSRRCVRGRWGAHAERVRIVDVDASESTWLPSLAIEETITIPALCVCALMWSRTSRRSTTLT
jgi:hypothetical protein